jgi:hypothetical protein
MNGEQVISDRLTARLKQAMLAPRFSRESFVCTFG